MKFSQTINRPKEYGYSLEVTGNISQCKQLTRLLGERSLLAKLQGKGISSHSTRRTFITELHKRGCDIYMIQQITGHKDLKALALYIEKDKKRVRSAIALGMKPLLLYHQDLRSTSQLIEGRLLLIDSETNTIKNTYIATSGLPGNQRYDCLSSRGKGPIPPINLVGIGSYTVATIALNMPNVRGVEGAFYKIDPHEVTVANMQRGDFGIHRDANVPGSSGCVVLRTELGWQVFEKDMQSQADAGIKQIPLLVSYSR